VREHTPSSSCVCSHVHVSEIFVPSSCNTRIALRSRIRHLSGPECSTANMCMVCGVEELLFHCVERNIVLLFLPLLRYLSTMWDNLWCFCYIICSSQAMFICVEFVIMQYVELLLIIYRIMSSVVCLSYSVLNSWSLASLFGVLFWAIPFYYHVGLYLLWCICVLSVCIMCDLSLHYQALCSAFVVCVLLTQNITIFRFPVGA